MCVGINEWMYINALIFGMQGFLTIQWLISDWHRLVSIGMVGGFFLCDDENDDESELYIHSTWWQWRHLSESKTPCCRENHGNKKQMLSCSFHSICVTVFFGSMYTLAVIITILALFSMLLVRPDADTLIYFSSFIIFELHLECNEWYQSQSLRFVLYAMLFSYSSMSQLLEVMGRWLCGISYNEG